VIVLTESMRKPRFRASVEVGCVHVSATGTTRRAALAELLRGLEASIAEARQLRRDLEAAEAEASAMWRAG